MSAYIVEEKTMDRVVAAWRHIHQTPERVEDCQALGERLYKLNSMAINERYGERDDGYADPPDWKLNGLCRVHSTCGRVQSYKSVKNLLYQCMEGRVPDHSDYKALEELSDRLAHQIVQATPEYDQADWG